MVNHNIGATIAELRKAKGWTQAELAEKLNVSDKAVSKWEQDGGYPSIEFFPLLAELFGVTIDYLMTGKTLDIKTVVLSPLENAVKCDDVEQLQQMGFDDYKKAYDYRTEEGKSLMDYVFQYESKKVFTWIAETFGALCPEQWKKSLNSQFFEFYENYYYMCLLCGIASEVDNLLLRGYADPTKDLSQRVYDRNYRPYGLSEDRLKDIEKYINRSIWSQGLQTAQYNYVSRRYDATIPFAMINDKMIEFILYDNRMDKGLRQSFLSVHQWEDGAFRYTAFIYPQFVMHALNKKDYALVEELLKIAIANNKQLGKSERHEWLTSTERRMFNEVINRVDLPDEVYNTLLTDGKFDLLDLANQLDKKVDDHTIKVYKNKRSNLSEKEQKLQAAIHGDVVCLDELIAINDFDLYEQTIEKYPISLWEIFARVAAGEEIDLTKYAERSNADACMHHFGCLSYDMERKIRDYVTYTAQSNTCDVKGLQFMLCDLYRYSLLEWLEFNGKYIKVYLSKPLHWINPNYAMSAIRVNMTPYQCFAQAKNYLFLNEVLDKHPKFIEKACKCADKKQLNAALLQINPEYFEGIKVLLDAGAMVQKTDYEGYSADDPIATAVLKRQINDILNKKQ